MFGEFICRQISKDSNYWNPVYSKVYEPLNKHLFISKLNMDYGIWSNEFGYNLGGDYDNHPWISVSDDTRKRIEKEMNTKHDIIRSHAFFPGMTANLPRLKKIRFYVEPDDIDYILYMCMIKCSMAINFDPDPSSDFARNALRKYNKFPDLEQKFMDNFSEVIEAEWYMMMLGIDNTQDYSALKYKVMNEFNDKRELFPDWIYLNPLSLLRNPETHVKEWQEIFDMHGSFDIDLIKKYMESNDNLIKETFGMEYTELKKHDSVSVMAETLNKLLVILPKRVDTK